MGNCGSQLVLYKMYLPLDRYCLFGRAGSAIEDHYLGTAVKRLTKRHVDDEADLSNCCS
jgi:hypothetical protein